MKKRYLHFALFLLVLGSMALFAHVRAQDQHEIYLPLISKDWPPACETNPYLVQTHDINPNPPGWDYWTIGSLSGGEAYVIFWSKLPGLGSTQYKLRLSPDMDFLFILAGGIQKHWGPGCTEDADSAFEAESFQEVDKAWLLEQGLLVDPAVCANDPTEEVRDPVVNVPWLLGGPRLIVVLNPGWSNQLPDDQGESKTLLYPEGNWQWPILMGGRAYTFPAGCGKQAEAFYNASNLPICDLQCLADRGLMAWPPAP